MFDKMIESSTCDAAVKPRSRYFVACTTVLATVFLGALVVSLYAQDFTLGTDNFDAAKLLAPIADVPEPVSTADDKTKTSQRPTDVPQRRVNMMQVSESTLAPTSITNTPNQFKERLTGRFIFGNNDTNPGGSPLSASSAKGTGTGSFTSDVETAPTAELSVKTVPPPIKTAPRLPVTLGVVNGRAIYLPKPAYSGIARMAGVQGEVNVQVTIDESGSVTSAKAASGHPMLRGPAEQAARSAKFSPTLLSKVPVKVTGVILYRFTKN